MLVACAVGCGHGAQEVTPAPAVFLPPDGARYVTTLHEQGVPSPVACEGFGAYLRARLAADGSLAQTLLASRGAAVGRLEGVRYERTRDARVLAAAALGVIPLVDVTTGESSPVEDSAFVQVMDFRVTEALAEIPEDGAFSIVTAPFAGRNAVNAACRSQLADELVFIVPGGRSELETELHQLDMAGWAVVDSGWYCFAGAERPWLVPMLSWWRSGTALTGADRVRWLVSALSTGTPAQQLVAAEALALAADEDATAVTTVLAASEGGDEPFETAVRAALTGRWAETATPWCEAVPDEVLAQLECRRVGPGTFDCPWQTLPLVPKRFAAPSASRPTR